MMLRSSSLCLASFVVVAPSMLACAESQPTGDGSVSGQETNPGESGDASQGSESDLSETNPGESDSESATDESGPSTTDPSSSETNPGESEDTGLGDGRRVPAEWEEQAAVWLQWPQVWEQHFEPAFVEIVRHASAHQEVHLLAHDNGTRVSGEQALAAGGVSENNVVWHMIPNDNAWMRDNGPRYVYEDDELIVQNWAFDAWGGNFGPGIPYSNDNLVPDAIAAFLGTPLEHYDLIHERGDLEFNGTDSLIVSWSVLSDRNPGLTKSDAETLFSDAFGVSSVIYIEGFHPQDGTTGHVDGFTRFISETEVVVGEISNPGADPLMAGLFDDVAEQIAEQRPDLVLTRMPFPAETDYMNWLVGNDYVISGAFGDAQADAEAQALIEGYFPGRTVYMVDVSSMWADGGGIHCVTNDQPI